MTSLLGRAGAAALATCALTLLGARTGHAFCRTTSTPIPPSYSPTDGCFTDGLPLFWKNACVGYSINSAASALVPFDEATRVIDAAFGTWNAAVCASTGTAVGITTSNIGPVTCSEVRYNPNGPNQNVIMFRDDKWPYSDPNNTLGLTTVTFNAETGELYDADMEINASEKNLTTTNLVLPNGFDLLSVMTHEAGHFLGLAHAVDSKATMFASYRPGTSALRSLTADDVAGICEIYPNATQRNVAASVNASGAITAGDCDPTPKRGFSGTCESNPAPSDSRRGGCTLSSGAVSNERSTWSTIGLATAVTMLSIRRARRRQQPS